MMSWDIKTAIKSGRTINGQTQGQLADALALETDSHWTRDMVAALESGKKNVSPSTLVALSKVQNLDYTFYLNGPSELNSPRGVWLRSLQPSAA